MDSGSFDVLLVTAGGQTFGVPTAQVASLTGEVLETAHDLSGALGLPPVARTAQALLTHSGTAWQVEAVGSLESLPLSALRRLPPLLASRSLPAAWGAAIHHNQLILLLDLDRLLAGGE